MKLSFSTKVYVMMETVMIYAMLAILILNLSYADHGMMRGRHDSMDLLLFANNFKVWAT
jgi:hypothetical protein